MKRTLLSLVALGLSSCATMKADRTVCPEYRDLRCMTRVECSMNAARGCQVCQCSPATGNQGSTPSGIAPDRRFP